MPDASSISLVKYTCLISFLLYLFPDPFHKDYSSNFEGLEWGLFCHVRQIIVNLTPHVVSKYRTTKTWTLSVFHELEASSATKHVLLSFNATRNIELESMTPPPTPFSHSSKWSL